MLRLLITVTALLTSACNRTPESAGSSSPPDAGHHLTTAEETALRKAAKLFVECNQPGGPLERLKECVDLEEFDRRILKGLKRVNPGTGGGKSSAGVSQAASDEQVAKELALAGTSLLFPRGGSLYAFVGISGRGFPIVRARGEYGGALNYGELIPAEQRDTSGGVKFVDCDLWGWAALRSEVARASLLSFTAQYVPAATDGWEGDVKSYGPAAGLLHWAWKSAKSLLPVYWSSLPVTFQARDIVALHLAVLAAEWQPEDGPLPGVLTESQAIWQQRQPDSPALLLRTLLPTRVTAELAGWRKLLAILEARGVSDPMLHQIIGGGLWCEGKADEARQTVEAALEKFPDDGGLLWLAFRIAVEGKSYAVAAERWHTLRRLFPRAASRNLAEDATLHGFLTSVEGREFSPGEDGPVSAELARELRETIFGPAATSGLFKPGEFTPAWDFETAFSLLFPEESLFQEMPGVVIPDEVRAKATRMLDEFLGAIGRPDITQSTSVRREHGRMVLQIRFSGPGRTWSFIGEHCTVIELVLTAAKPWRITGYTLPEAGFSGSALITGDLSINSILQWQMAAAENKLEKGAPSRFLPAPSLFYVRNRFMDWKAWQTPGIQAQAKTPLNLCTRVKLASESTEVTDAEYLAVRQELSAGIGETLWLRARDVVRAGTMKRGDEVITLCKPLLAKGILSVPAAWQLFLAGCGKMDWALAVQALNSRKRFDEQHGYKTIRRDLEQFASEPLWPQFKKSPEGAKWFAEFQRLETQDVPPASLPDSSSGTTRSESARPGFQSTSPPSGYPPSLLENWDNSTPPKGTRPIPRKLEGSPSSPDVFR